MSYSTIGGLITALVLVVGLYAYSQNVTHTPALPAWVNEFNTAPGVTNGESSAIKVTPGVERWYTHDSPRYSFQLPDGYEAPDIETETPGVYGVVVRNNAGSELVAYVHPIASGVRVDEATIRAYVPQQTISAFQESTLGPLVRGVKFYSTQEDGGSTVHLWAAYNGYVYMVSAPTEDEALFTFITERWMFAPPVPSAPIKE